MCHSTFYVTPECVTPLSKVRRIKSGIQPRTLDYELHAFLCFSGFLSYFSSADYQRFRAYIRSCKELTLALIESPDDASSWETRTKLQNHRYFIPMTCYNLCKTFGRIKIITDEWQQITEKKISHWNYHVFDLHRQ